MRRALRKTPRTPSEARLKLPSSMQKASSGAGTMISALGKASGVVLGLDAVDVVGMEVRDRDRVDRLRIDAGGREVGGQRAGGVGHLPAGAGVDEHELRSGVHDQRRERDRELAGVRHVGVGHRFLHVGESGVAHEVSHRSAGATRRRGPRSAHSRQAGCGRRLGLGGPKAAPRRAKVAGRVHAARRQSQLLPRRLETHVERSRHVGSFLFFLKKSSSHCTPRSWQHSGDRGSEAAARPAEAQRARMCPRAVGDCQPLSRRRSETVCPVQKPLAAGS